MDALLLLRQQTMAEKDVPEDGNNLVFGDKVCLKTAKTNLKMYVKQLGLSPPPHSLSDVFEAASACLPHLSSS